MKKKIYLIIFVISTLAYSADCDNFLYFVLWHVAFLIPLIWSGIKLIEEDEKC